MLPLAGIRVLDFSTLLPGPMAGLFLVEADLAAGTYPTVTNVLLALLRRQRTGQGRHLDISMTDNLFVLACRGLAGGFAAGAWPMPGGERYAGRLIPSTDAARS
jgi:crotonobetainyl-CoA:carnitine CoA-transferase CaiB-like acyl-CoA transferase